MRWARALLNQHRVQDSIDRAKPGRDAGAAQRRGARSSGAGARLERPGRPRRPGRPGGRRDRIGRRRPHSAPWPRRTPTSTGCAEADERLASAMQRAPNDAELVPGRGIDARGAGRLRRRRRIVPPRRRACAELVLPATRASATRCGRKRATTRRWRRSGAQWSLRRRMPAPRVDVAWSTTPARRMTPRSRAFSGRWISTRAYPTAHAQLGWIYYGRREYDRAEPFFSRAIELDRDAGPGGAVPPCARVDHAERAALRRGPRAVHTALEFNPNLQGARDGLRLAQGQGPTPCAATPRSLSGLARSRSARRRINFAREKLCEDLAATVGLRHQRSDS